MEISNPLQRLEELVARRQVLLTRIPQELDFLVQKSLKRELRAISKEAQNFAAALTGYATIAEISRAVNEGLSKG